MRRKSRTRIVEAIHDELVKSVRDSLSPELLKPQFKDQPFPVGHCYVAAEACYHLMGGKASGLKPMRLRMPDGVVHWWLQDADGSIIDPTHDQYEHIPYEEGRAGGFLTREPSKRTQEVMRRVTGKQLPNAPWNDPRWLSHMQHGLDDTLGMYGDHQEIENPVIPFIVTEDGRQWVGWDADSHAYDWMIEDAESELEIDYYAMKDSQGSVNFAGPDYQVNWPLHGLHRELEAAIEQKIVQDVEENRQQWYNSDMNAYKHMAKTAMAERTGDPTLDALLEEVRNPGGGASYVKVGAKDKWKGGYCIYNDGNQATHWVPGVRPEDGGRTSYGVCDQHYVVYLRQYHDLAKSTAINPVNYQYVPLTQQELSLYPYGGNVVFRNRARKLNQRAHQLGAQGTVSATELYALAKRYQDKCAYCDRPLLWGNANSQDAEGTFDHNIPLTQGGSHTVDNLLPTCRRCNNDLDEWDKSLRSDIYGPGDTIHNWRSVPEEFRPSDYMQRNPLKGYEQQRTSGTQPIELMCSPMEQDHFYKYMKQYNRFAWVYKDDTLYVGNRHPDIIRNMRMEGLNPKVGSVFGWYDPYGRQVGDLTPGGYEIYSDTGEDDQSIMDLALTFLNAHSPEEVLAYFQVPKRQAAIHDLSGPMPDPETLNAFDAYWKDKPRTPILIDPKAGDIYRGVMHGSHSQIYRVLKDQGMDVRNKPWLSAMIWDEGIHDVPPGVYLHNWRPQNYEKGMDIIKQHFPESDIYSFNKQQLYQAPKEHDQLTIPDVNRVAPAPRPTYSGWTVHGAHADVEIKDTFDPQTGKGNRRAYDTDDKMVGEIMYWITPFNSVHVDWLYVDDPYRDSDLMLQLIEPVRQMVNSGMELGAKFDNDRLKEMVLRYLNRQDLPIEGVGDWPHRLVHNHHVAADIPIYWSEDADTGDIEGRADDGSRIRYRVQPGIVYVDFLRSANRRPDVMNALIAPVIDLVNQGYELHAGFVNDRLLEVAQKRWGDQVVDMFRDHYSATETFRSTPILPGDAYLGMDGKMYIDSEKEDEGINLWDGDNLIGSTLYLLDESVGEMYVYVLAVAERYRNTSAFAQLALYLKHLADEHEVEISAQYENDRLRDVVDRWMERSSALHLQQVDPNDAQDYITWSGKGRDRDDPDRNDVEWAWESQTGQVYNLYDDDRLVGTISYDPHQRYQDSPTGECVKVYSMYVDPQYRGGQAFAMLAQPVVQAMQETGNPLGAVFVDYRFENVVNRWLHRGNPSGEDYILYGSANPWYAIEKDRQDNVPPQQYVQIADEGDDGAMVITLYNALTKQQRQVEVDAQDWAEYWQPFLYHVDQPKVAAQTIAMPMKPWDAYDPYPTGLPRPIWDNMPVPWSGQTTPRHDEPGLYPDFPLVDLEKLQEAHQNDLCIVCGDPLDDPVWFFQENGEIIDKGGMHERCAKLTAAHCPHIRDRLVAGGNVEMDSMDLADWQHQYGSRSTRMGGLLNSTVDRHTAHVHTTHPSILSPYSEPLSYSLSTPNPISQVLTKYLDFASEHTRQSMKSQRFPNSGVAYNAPPVKPLEHYPHQTSLPRVPPAWEREHLSANGEDFKPEDTTYRYTINPENWENRPTTRHPDIMYHLTFTGVPTQGSSHEYDYDPAVYLFDTYEDAEKWAQYEFYKGAQIVPINVKGIPLKFDAATSLSDTGYYWRYEGDPSLLKVSLTEQMEPHGDDIEIIGTPKQQITDNDFDDQSFIYQDGALYLGGGLWDGDIWETHPRLMARYDIDKNRPFLAGWINLKNQRISIFSVERGDLMDRSLTDHILPTLQRLWPGLPIYSDSPWDQGGRPENRIAAGASLKQVGDPNAGSDNGLTDGSTPFIYQNNTLYWPPNAALGTHPQMVRHYELDRYQPMALGWIRPSKKQILFMSWEVRSQNQEMIKEVYPILKEMFPGYTAQTRSDFFMASTGASYEGFMPHYSREVNVQIVPAQSYLVGPINDSEPPWLADDNQHMTILNAVDPTWPNNQGVVGSIIYDVRDHIPSNRSLYVEWLYVDPAYRDTNVSNQLMAPLAQIAREQQLPIKGTIVNNKLFQVVKRWQDRNIMTSAATEWFHSWLYIPAKGGLYINERTHGNHAQLIQEHGLRSVMAENPFIPGQLWMHSGDEENPPSGSIEINSDWLENEIEMDEEAGGGDFANYEYPEFWSNIVQKGIGYVEEWFRNKYPGYNLYDPYGEKLIEGTQESHTAGVVGYSAGPYSDQAFIYQDGNLYLGGDGEPGGEMWETHPQIAKRNSIDKKRPYLPGWFDGNTDTVHLNSMEEWNAGAMSLFPEALPLIRKVWPYQGIYTSPPWSEEVDEDERIASGPWSVQILPPRRDWTIGGEEPRIAWVADKNTGRLVIGPGWLHPAILREMKESTLDIGAYTEMRDKGNWTAGVYQDGKIRWHADGEGIDENDLNQIEQTLQQKIGRVSSISPWLNQHEAKLARTLPVEIIPIEQGGDYLMGETDMQMNYWGPAEHEDEPYLDKKLSDGEGYNAWVFGKLVGSILYRMKNSGEPYVEAFGDGSGRDMIYIAWLYVHPRYRDSNVFLELVKPIIQLAKTNNYQISADYENTQLENVVHKYVQKNLAKVSDYDTNEHWNYVHIKDAPQDPMFQRQLCYLVDPETHTVYYAMGTTHGQLAGKTGVSLRETLRGFCDDKGDNAIGYPEIQSHMFYIRDHLLNQKTAVTWDQFNRRFEDGADAFPGIISFGYDGLNDKLYINTDVGCAPYHPVMAAKIPELKAAAKMGEVIWGSGSKDDDGSWYYGWDSLEEDQGDLAKYQQRANQLLLERMPQLRPDDVSTQSESSVQNRLVHFASEAINEIPVETSGMHPNGDMPFIYSKDLNTVWAGTRSGRHPQIARWIKDRDPELFAKYLQVPQPGHVFFGEYLPDSQFGGKGDIDYYDPDGNVISTWEMERQCPELVAWAREKFAAYGLKDPTKSLTSATIEDYAWSH